MARKTHDFGSKYGINIIFNNIIFFWKLGILYYTEKHVQYIVHIGVLIRFGSSKQKPGEED